MSHGGESGEMEVSSGVGSNVHSAGVGGGESNVHSAGIGGGESNTTTVSHVDSAGIGGGECRMEVSARGHSAGVDGGDSSRLNPGENGGEGSGGTSTGDGSGCDSNRQVSSAGESDKIEDGEIILPTAPGAHRAEGCRLKRCVEEVCNDL